MKLIQISDCHLFDDTEKTGNGDINPYHTLSRVLDDVMQQGCDAVIVTGDISEDDSHASYSHFMLMMEEKLGELPWKMIPGNHDNNDHFEELSQRHLVAGDPWDLEKWCLHGLDSRTSTSQGNVDQKQLAATESALAQYTSKYHLLCLHHHLIDTNSWMEKHNMTNAEDVLDWITDQPQLEHVIHGHIHSPVESDYQGNKIYAAPATCWQYALSEEFALADEAPGYRIIELLDDGTFTTSVRRIS
ncbi:metallophosphoesterase [Alteromonas halophila]|uniref:3',5'-cyclic adenosine monophosphate phosphodiesterase CpdA n=1 Tax=Alteromonas halophila TaxID=516698 RepID=A0A918MW54_9ALTE|nr:metallophosphoesterase [Alteromonas halophila]GGW80175.1 3',5'-cyclic adenosine monophosphate phosphodiesterase CpdA [Alteromonas halophila]